MEAIAAHALSATERLPNAVQHTTILAAMSSFYLSSPTTATPAALPAARRVLETMGALAMPTMAVLRARRTAHKLLDSQVLDFPLVRRGAPAR